MANITTTISLVTPHIPKPSISTFTTKTPKFTSSRLHKFYACAAADSHHNTFVQRRNLAVGIAVAAVLGLNSGGGNAWAAARRPPAAPPGEKKDPNVTGLAAKVLASKKRKEAMKDTIAKLRDQGNALETSLIP